MRNNDLIHLTAAMALAVAAVFASSAFAGKPGESPGRNYSTVERMLTERLEAVHADVQRIQAQRRPVAFQTGLNDYRSILHVHADDSTHTGGTLPEMLADAKRAGVKVIMLTDHFRPPRDFMDGWRGMRDGVLIIPGSEAHGFLLYPTESIMDVMSAGRDPIIERTGAGEGLLFLSHVEARVDHPMDGLTGMEIYNRHADASDDPGDHPDRAGGGIGPRRGTQARCGRLRREAV